MNNVLRYSQIVILLGIIGMGLSPALIAVESTNVTSKLSTLDEQIRVAEVNFSQGNFELPEWSMSSMLKKKQVPLAELSNALSLHMQILAGRGELKEIRDLFANHAKSPAFEVIDDSGLKALAIGLKGQGQGNSHAYLSALTRLILHYPISEESRWAMQELEAQRCATNELPHLNVKDLRKLSRNASVDSGLLDWIYHLLDFPLVMQDQSIRKVVGVEKLETAYYLRLYQHAYDLGRKMLREDLSPGDNVKVLSLVGDALSALGHHKRAIHYYGRAVAEDPKENLEIMESLASSLAKTGLFSAAAQYYQSLNKKSPKSSYAWNVFWNYYRAGKYPLALKTLENISLPAHNRGLLQRDSIKYWQGRILNQMGRQNEAKRLLSRMSLADDRSVYGVFASAPEPSARIPDMSKFSEMDQDLRQTILTFAKEAEVDSDLVLSIVYSESRFKQTALSQVGARGLMQLMPYTAVRVAKIIDDHSFNLAKLNDVRTNIRLGSHYLKMLLDYYDGSEGLAVAAYNAGPKAVRVWLKACLDCTLDEFIETITYRETKKYVREVLGNYYSLQMKKDTFQGANLSASLPKPVKDPSLIF